MKDEKIIIYDFDGTLTPYSLPRFEILEKCGENINNFYADVKKKVKENNLDLSKTFYKVFFEVIKNSGSKLTDDNFCIGSDTVSYNNGVPEFLEYLNENGVKNYLLSSGIKVYLDRTKIAGMFSKIYATTFTYDESHEATGIDYLMSDKNKVEAIKEIAKENGYEEDDCRDIIYVGDGLTDYYAMDYVKRHGGTTIFVYQNEDSKEMEAIREKDVVTHYAHADYSEVSELSTYIKKLCGLDKHL